MKHMHKMILAGALLVAFNAITRAAENRVLTPALVPIPLKMNIGRGAMKIDESTVIVTADASLEPLAQVLASEIELVTEIKPTVAMNSKPKPGDIELVLTRAGDEEAYSLTVGKTAKVQAKTYQGMAYGTTTLVQTITKRERRDPKTRRWLGNDWLLPHMTIEDEPSKPFRGVLIDIARRYNSPRALRLVIQLARYYKIRYITLHLNDDQAWTFPLKSFPKAGTMNQGFRGPRPRLYTLKEFKDLVKFADERGVTLVPEIEFPAHCNSIRRLPEYTDIFNSFETGKSLGLADMANPKIYPAIQKIYAEVSEVFKSSPYIHIGCDEANIRLLQRDTNHYRQFMAGRKLKNVHDLFHYFAAHLANYAKENGKTAIFWADGLKTWDHGLPHQLPRDMIAMDWRSRYKSTVKAKYHLEAGHKVINAVWTPMYQVNLTWEKLQNLLFIERAPKRFDGQKEAHMPKTIYEWSPYIFYRGVMEVKPTDDVIGSQLTVWESGGEIYVDSLRRPLAAMAERVWNLDAGQSYEQFEERLNVTNSRLSVLIQPLNPFKWGEIDNYETD